MQDHWRRYITTIPDEPYALLIPKSRNGSGAGVVGSIHMALRAEEETYLLHLAVLRLTLCCNKGVCGVLTGDWNRNIRIHGPTQAFLGQLGA